MTCESCGFSVDCLVCESDDVANLERPEDQRYRYLGEGCGCGLEASPHRDGLSPDWPLHAVRDGYCSAHTRQRRKGRLLPFRNPKNQIAPGEAPQGSLGVGEAGPGIVPDNQGGSVDPHRCEPSNQAPVEPIYPGTGGDGSVERVQGPDQAGCVGVEPCGRPYREESREAPEGGGSLKLKLRLIRLLPAPLQVRFFGYWVDEKLLRHFTMKAQTIMVGAKIHPLTEPKQ